MKRIWVGLFAVCLFSSQTYGFGCADLLDSDSKNRRELDLAQMRAWERALMQRPPFIQRDELYARVRASAYQDLPGLNLAGIWRTTIGALNLVIPSRLKQTILRPGFLLPDARNTNKVIHTFGSVATANVIIEKTGEQIPVLVRASMAGPPAIIGNVPGVAVMFFEKGETPTSLFLMNQDTGLDPSGKSTSIFAQNLTNILPPPKTIIMKAIKLLFENVVKKGRGLVQMPDRDVLGDLSDFQDETGAFRVVAQPSRVVLEQWGNTTTRDFRTDLAEIPRGTELWTLRAMRPDYTGPSEVVARVVLDEPFIASEFGDKQVFFRHGTSERIEEKGSEFQPEAFPPFDPFLPQY